MAWWAKSVKFEAFGKSTFRDPIVVQADDEFGASTKIAHEFKKIRCLGLSLHEIEKRPAGPYTDAQEAYYRTVSQEQALSLQKQPKLSKVVA